MLFPSPEFLFGFLPVSLLGFFLLARVSHRLAIAWLGAASLVFYGWWSVAHIWILLASIGVNFIIGSALLKIAAAPMRKAVLTVGVAFNVILLGYFKYYGFFIGQLIALGVNASAVNIILPLGISFFTFTQIAFIVDAYRRQVADLDFVSYLLFVTYFPHLIAGPILHHRPMMRQFADRAVSVFSSRNFSIGLTFLVIGLFKKLAIADQIGGYANDVFEVAGNGIHPSAASAWVGALAYTFQLYFDFSGYCDMAIGVSRMLNIKIPYNFASPYKSTSIIEFWRRWHMTLSSFLRDYLYIPLGGSRKGPRRRFINLFLTMLLGGIWHGAGWTFVIWGALHGSFLVVNHAWVAMKKRLGWAPRGGLYASGAWLLTFLCVVVGWVYFKAPTAEVAHVVLRSMAGKSVENFSAFNAIEGSLYIAFLIALVLVLPNSQQIVDGEDNRRALWRASAGWGLWVGALAGVAACVLIAGGSTLKNFLYFQF